MATRTPTYYTGTITGQAGTLITVLDAILVTGEGWTKTYSGTNKAVYTQATGNGFCFRVLDDGSGAGGATEAEVRGGESASDVDTLVDPFPTVAQVTNANCTWKKSSTADATARTYHAVADGSSLVLLIYFGGVSTAAEIYFFCDTEPHYTGDGYNTFITVRHTSNSAASPLITLSYTSALTNTSTTARIFFARSADGLVKSDMAWVVGLNGTFGHSNFTDPDYPNTATNKLHLGFFDTLSAYSNTTTAIQSGGMLRGVIPHILDPHLGSGVGTMVNEDTFADTSYDATSSSLKILQVQGGTFSTMRKVVFQIAGTWDPGY